MGNNRVGKKIKHDCLSQASYFTCSFKPPCISDLIRQEEKRGRGEITSFSPSGQGLRPLVVGGKKKVLKRSVFLLPAIREMVFGFGWLMDGFCLRWGGGDYFIYRN